MRKELINFEGVPSMSHAVDFFSINADVESNVKICRKLPFIVLGNVYLVPVSQKQ